MTFGTARPRVDLRPTTDRRLTWLLASFVALATSFVVFAGQNDSSESQIPSTTIDTKSWDDGRAEFAAYEVDWPRYGRTYPGRALLVTVKEPWDVDREVKANGPGDANVIKLNHIREVTTGIYRYHQMASLFWDRSDARLRKLQTSHLDSCGQSSARWSQNSLETRSYFNGDETVARKLGSSELTEDGLPWTLRAWVHGPLPERLDLLPSLMHDRLTDLDSFEVGLERKAPREIELPAGRFTGIELILKGADRWLSFVFDSESPHLLLEMRDSKGTHYRLAKAERLAYWRMVGPEHESWWPAQLR